MKKLAVIVTTSPTSHLTKTAYHYVENAIKANIEIVGVFFYQAGVLNASTHLTFPSDEFQITQAWQTLALESNVALHLCSTAAEKHGLLTQDNNVVVNNEFTISGLGELVELISAADQVVQL